MKCVDRVSECFIKPETLPQHWNQPLHLNPWDLLMLSAHYIQKGLLYSKPPNCDAHFMDTQLHRLKHSLSLALVHFYPLAGRLKTIKTHDHSSLLVFVDCRDSPGAKFIHATLHITSSDLLSSTDVPTVVHSFFDHHKAVNHDGHVTTLLSIQVTELLDAVFIGCSMNHCLGDGTSFWNFLNSWSEIFQAKLLTPSISRPPIFNRWNPPGHVPPFSLPFDEPDEFISRFEAPVLRERMFHFSAESVSKLKAKANAECNNIDNVSSLQSLAALLWRCITRARNLQPDQMTSCMLAANNRSRMEPPISENYFGNSIAALKASASANDLLEHDLGWAALKVHRAVVNHDHGVVHEFLEEWFKSPYIYQIGRFFDPCSVMLGSSPRFNKYGSEFGMGKALALRSGYANKFSGKVTCYPGREGGGSVDLEICLPPETMLALESDCEFLVASGLV